MEKVTLAALTPLADDYLKGSPHPTTYGQFLSPLINNVLVVMGVAALFFMLFAGFNYINSGGDKAKVQQASSMLTYTILGLIVIAAAYVITKLAGALTGFDVFSPK